MGIDNKANEIGDKGSGIVPIADSCTGPSQVLGIYVCQSPFGICGGRSSGKVLYNGENAYICGAMEAVRSMGVKE